MGGVSGLDNQQAYKMLGPDTIILLSSMKCCLLGVSGATNFYLLSSFKTPPFQIHHHFRYQD